jgi:hypothetical protein
MQAPCAHPRGAQLRGGVQATPLARAACRTRAAARRAALPPRAQAQKDEKQVEYLFGAGLPPRKSELVAPNGH